MCRTCLWRGRCPPWRNTNTRVGGTGTQAVGGVVVATGVPGDEERGVVVGRMAVVLDVLALLPDAEVVESGGGVEAHRRPFLFTHIRDA